MFNFDNSFLSLPNSFYSFVEAQKFKNVQLVEFNFKLAAELGLNYSHYSENQLAKIFSGQSKLKNAANISMVYAGHQFAYFVPKLGDGRALLLGELLNNKKMRFDVQLKGSGTTPYSRRGDGKAAIGPVLREYILSEAMHNLGVASTRALAVVQTGETVYREEPLKGAVFTRVSKSHIRIGTFQYFSNIKDYENLKLLTNYTIKRLYPELFEQENSYILFLKELINKQAKLIAQWMSIGFIHGVMNTDNMSISAETIDYGPCAFMDEFKFDKVYSYIDTHGRYAYKNQPSIALWNLRRFAETLLDIIDIKNKETILEYELEQFNKIFKNKYLSLMLQKLGLFTKEPDDELLINNFLNYLEKEKLDYTISFRNLKNLLLGTSNFIVNDDFLSFKTHWESRLKKENLKIEELIKKLDTINPIYIPRNHQLEIAIKYANEDNFTYFKKLNKVLEDPFTEKKEFYVYSLAPAPHERVFQTFCGT